MLWAACTSCHPPPVPLITGHEVMGLRFSLAVTSEEQPRLWVTQLLKDWWSTCRSTDFKRCLCPGNSLEKHIYQVTFCLGCLVLSYVTGDRDTALGLRDVVLL